MAVLQASIRRLRDTARLRTRWSPLPVAELIAVLFIAGGAIDFSKGVLGIRNPAIAAVFALVWLRPAVTKLSGLRRGHYIRWNICANRPFETAAMLIGGTAPWAIMAFLHLFHRSYAARQLVDVPLGVRICGAALAILVVATQHTRATTTQDLSARALLPDVTLRSHLFIVSLLMMSGSAFIGLLGAGWVLSPLVGFARVKHQSFSCVDTIPAV